MAKLIDLDGLAYFYGKIKAMLAEKLGKNDTAANAAKVNGLTVETAVPKNAKFTDTIYTHPATHPASMITGLATVAKSGSYNDLTNKPTIPTLDGYAKTSVANTWTAEQTFQQLAIMQEKYSTSVINGTSDTPTLAIMAYAVTGAFTLNLSTLVGRLSNGQSSVFTAYFSANGDYSLTISNAGTLKYIGSASDVAITSAGLLLTILMTKDASGTLTSIVQASKLA